MFRPSPLWALTLTGLALCTLPLRGQHRPTLTVGPESASSVHPYSGNDAASLVWSHTFHKKGATQSVLTLRMDLGLGDYLVLRDSSGVEQFRYTGRGPIAPAAVGQLPLPDLVMGPLPSQTRFVSGAVLGDTSVVELYGRAGGYGVDVLQVAWGDQPIIQSLNTTVCAINEVVPSGFEGVEGGFSSAFPFGQAGPMRAMYAYGGSELGIDRAVRFCGIRLRPNGGGAASLPGSHTFQLRVSTSRNPATNLDRRFDNNHGGDIAFVFNGTVNVPAAPLGGSPNDFILEIPFTGPFEWDPSCGPLLLDFLYSGGVATVPSYDGVLSGADVGRIVHLTDSNATTADFPSTGTQRFGFVVDLCLDADTVPDSLANTAGNSTSSYPWDRPAGSSMRLQQIYDPGVLGINGRHRITHLAYRTANGAAFAADTFDMRIMMSTAATTSTTLSATFAANHGSDLATVFSGVHSAESMPAVAPGGAYSLVIPLDEPFEYNPNNGSLLVEVRLRNSGGAINPLFEGSFNTGIGVGRVSDSTNANATTGSVQDFALTMGLLTENGPTSPEISDIADGSSSSNFPWGSTSPMRAQYRYASSAFASGDFQYIQHLAFRPNMGDAYGPATFRCTIDMSLVPIGSALTTNFDNNHGSRRARVFDGSFSVPYSPATTDLSTFPIVVKLDTPFLHAPGVQELIVDIRLLGSVGDLGPCDGSSNGNERIVHRTDPNATVGNFGPQGFGLTMRTLGDGCNGLSRNYGVGCAAPGATHPRCATFGRATLPNSGFGIRLLNGPTNSFSFLVIGLTQANLPLGGSLAGCTGLTGGEVGSLGVPTNSTGEAFVPVSLPNDPSFAGFQFYTQWASLDAAANPLGLSFSDGQEHTVCY